MRVVHMALCIMFVINNLAHAANDVVSAELATAVTSVYERLDLAAGEGASGILRIKYGDTLLVETGFGSASCSMSEDVTPDHIFMIGSITKEFTRVLGFVLEEKGVLSLNSTVSEVLSDFRGPIGRVTLQQLMNHTGGLPDLVDQDGQPVPYTIEYDYAPVSRDALIDRAGLARLVAEPGEIEQYSNLGYQLLAAIYEVATGETFPDLLRRYVYGPAKMRDTDFWFSDSGLRAFADGCRAKDDHWGNPIDDEMWDESGPSWNLMGAGGLLSTADSLGHFFDAIGDGVYFDNPAQLERYRRSRMVYSQSRQQHVMGPAGSNGVFNAAAFWADADRFSVILMTNRADHTAEGGLIQDILGLFPPTVFANRDEE